MIFELLDAFNRPQDFACKIDREGIHLAPVSVLKSIAEGKMADDAWSIGEKAGMTHSQIENLFNLFAKIDAERTHAKSVQAGLVSTLFVIATNEEFTPDQRRDIMTAALNDYDRTQADNHPTSLALERALKTEQMDVGIRISPNAGIPIGS